MSRVVLFFESTYGENFFRGLATSMLEAGNDVCLVNLLRLSVNQDIRNMIKDFSPDLIISFNFRVPDGFIKLIKEGCKFIVFDTDTPENFEDKYELLMQLVRKGYAYYVSVQKEYKDYLPNETKIIKQTCYCPPATNFSAHVVEPKRNICFLGTNWYYDPIQMMDGLKIEDLLAIYHNTMNDYYKFKTDGSYILKWNMAGFDRVKYLSVLTDLGLEIYGDRWDKLFFDLDVLGCVRGGSITRLREVEDLYNTSLLSLNISHPQATSGFSFRCMDIMATNSVLIMEQKPAFFALFGKFLDADIKRNFFFTDRYDLREKVKRILCDDDLRKHAIKKFNDAIEFDGRWKHRLPILSALTNISLNCSNCGKGKFLDLSREDHLSVSEEIKNDYLKLMPSLNSMEDSIKIRRYDRLVSILKKILPAGTRREKIARWVGELFHFY